MRNLFKVIFLAFLPLSAIAQDKIIDECVPLPEFFPYKAGIEAEKRGKDSKAFEIYCSLAVQGDYRAQFKLAKYYLDGIRGYIEPNKVLAHVWSRMSIFSVQSRKRKELEKSVKKTLTEHQINRSDQIFWTIVRVIPSNQRIDMAFKPLNLEDYLIKDDKPRFSREMISTRIKKKEKKNQNVARFVPKNSDDVAVVKLSEEELSEVGGEDALLIGLLEMAISGEANVVVDINVEELEEEARQGNADAYYKLGLVAENKGDSDANEYYESAAALDHIEAAKKVSSKKYLEVLQRKSAEGDEEAMSDLAGLYYKGDIVKKDRKRSLEIYKKLAQKGNTYSQYSIGWSYEFGQGTNKDLAKAVDWYLKASKSGSENATIRLAELYLRGKHFKKDYQKAHSLYKSISESNDEAAFETALMELMGKGVQQKIVEANSKLKKLAGEEEEYAVRLARIYCTSTDQKVRNSKFGFELLNFIPDEGVSSRHLDTIAACHAESGDFTSAVRYMHQAIELAEEKELKSLNKRLDLFRGKRKLREKVWKS